MLEQKYRPANFSDLVFQNEVTKARLEAYATGKRKDNLLLHGLYGTAKSTTARIIAQTSRKAAQSLFEMDVDVVNCANLREDDSQSISFDVIERGFNVTGHQFPYAVLDEFDLLSSRQQNSARAFMDRNLGRAGLILTTNYLRRVDGAIQSRCEIVELAPLQPDALLTASQKILAAEGVKIPDASVLALIETSKSDWRQLLRFLEDVVNRVREKNAA